MTLSEIVHILDATLITGKEQLETEILKGGASDLMSDILKALSEGSVLLTGLISIQVVKTAMVAGVGAVVFVRGKQPPPDIVELARAGGIPLLSTPYSMFVSCGRLHGCGLTGLDGRK